MGRIFLWKRIEKIVVLKKKNAMPRKVDKSLQNPTIQGILEQENFMIRVLFVCHGNICRSVAAQYILQDLVRQQGWESGFQIDSAAATSEEIGNPIYPPMEEELRRRGIPIGNHRARLLRREDYDRWDLFIGMNQENMRDIRRILGRDPEKKIHLLMEFAGRPGQEIEDPWWTERFAAVADQLEEGCRALLVQYTKGE